MYDEKVAPALPESKCLGEAQMETLYRLDCTAERWAELAEHLDACPSCSDRYAAYMQAQRRKESAA